MIYRIVLIGWLSRRSALDAFRLTNGLIREAADFPAKRKRPPVVQRVRWTRQIFCNQLVTVATRRFHQGRGFLSLDSCIRGLITSNLLPTTRLQIPLLFKQPRWFLLQTMFSLFSVSRNRNGLTLLFFPLRCCCTRILIFAFSFLDNWQIDKFIWYLQIINEKMLICRGWKNWNLSIFKRLALGKISYLLGRWKSGNHSAGRNCTCKTRTRSWRNLAVCNLPGNLSSREKYRLNTV